MRGLKQGDLAGIVAQSNLYVILAGKRKISAILAGKLAKHFNVSGIRACLKTFLGAATATCVTGLVGPNCASFEHKGAEHEPRFEAACAAGCEHT
jgi:hypothetical protein